MTYAVAYQLAEIAAEQYMKREAARQEEASIGRVIDAVNAAKQEVLNALRQMQIKDLMGDLVGLSKSMDNYRRLTNTRNFLEEILRDSDALSGDLLQEVQGYRTNPQMALDAYPIMLTHTSVVTCCLRSSSTSGGRMRAR